MATIPAGLPVPSVARFILDTGDQFLGAGHYMNTRAGFDTNTGLILATTKTWTGTWFGGFHGSVDVLLTDSDGLPVQVAMPSETYGVDGTANSVAVTDTLPARSRSRAVPSLVRGPLRC